MTFVSERRSSMSTLIVIAYPGEHRAAEVLATLKQLRSEDLIDLDDAFYVTKDQEGDTKVHHAVHLTRKGAGWGALGGLLTAIAPVAAPTSSPATGRPLERWLSNSPTWGSIINS